jgi:hypothetical protein
MGPPGIRDTRQSLPSGRKQFLEITFILAQRVVGVDPVELELVTWEYTFSVHCAEGSAASEAAST